MKVYIIAEAGVNHNGSLELAKQLVDQAAECGCDCIKFQTFKTENLVTKSAKKAEYQVANTHNEDSQFSMLKKLELSFHAFKELKDYCEKKQIDFMSTPFDYESVDLLEELDVKVYKMSSGDITNKQLLQYVAKKGKPMIISTGMCTLDEVDEAVSWIEECGNKNITILHCTSNYPAPYDEVNMNAMLTLRDRYPYPAGYSDHTKGIEIPIMAVSMGAVVIEKHFTLDNNMEGPDHKASLNVDDLKMMVSSIRHIEKAFGDGNKVPSQSELSTREVARKSIVVNRDIKAGSVISNADLSLKRPGTGILPKFLDDLIGKRVKRELKADEMLAWEDVEE